MLNSNKDVQDQLVRLVFDLLLRVFEVFFRVVRVVFGFVLGLLLLF